MQFGRGLSLLVLMLLAGVAAPAVVSASPATTSATSSEVRFTNPSLQAMEDQPQVRVMVERADLPVTRLVVTYRTEAATALAGQDYVEAAGTLVFEVGARTQTFSISPRDDEVIEEAEHLMLHLQTSSGNGTATRLLLVDDDARTASAANDTAAPVAAAPAPAPRPARRPVTPSNAAAPGAVAVGAPRPPRVSAGQAVPRTTTEPRRRVTMQQSRVTPFELRPSAPQPAGSSGDSVPGELDPVLALAAGLLLARVAAEVWFRARTAVR